LIGHDSIPDWPEGNMNPPWFAMQFLKTGHSPSLRPRSPHPMGKRGERKWLRYRQLKRQGPLQPPQILKVEIARHRNPKIRINKIK